MNIQTMPRYEHSEDTRSEVEKLSNLQDSRRNTSKTSSQVEVFLVSRQGSKTVVVQPDSSTVEQLMHRLFIEHRDFFRQESIYDLNFYAAKKSGEPKGDIPGKFNSFGQISVGFDLQLRKICDDAEI